MRAQADDITLAESRVWKNVAAPNVRRCANRHRREDRGRQYAEQRGLALIAGLEPGENLMSRGDFGALVQFVHFEQPDRVTKALRSGMLKLGDVIVRRVREH